MESHINQGWGFINWSIVALYLVFALFIGLWFSKRNKNSKDYFLGGQRVPAWVTSLSIYSTMLSSISYIAIPASIYKNGIVVAFSSLGIIPLVFLVAHFVVPVYRSVVAVTSYQYLEMRFKSRFFRIIGALAFTLFHIARIGIVLYIPAIALQTVFPDANPILLMIITGVVCVLYTTLSGIEGVAWQDAFQAIILIFGCIAMIVVGLSYTPEQGLFATLTEQGKNLSADSFKLSLSGDNLWSVVIANGIIGSIYSYVGSQDVVQRYQITKTEAEAKRSVTFNAPLLVISVLMFVGVGSAMIIFFNYSGNTLPANVSGNALVPYFIFNFLPVGVSALVIVAVLAATQSTVSSSLNSLATCLTNDLLFPDSKDDKLKLKTGQIASLFFGFVGTCLAYYLTQVGQGDLFKLFVNLTALIGGPIAAVFLLAIFWDRAGKGAGLVALFVGIAISVYLSNPFKLPYTPIEVNPFLKNAVIIGFAYVAGVLASYVFAAPSKESIWKLTYKTVVESRQNS